MLLLSLFLFFFNDTATTEIYPLSLHDALPIWMSEARLLSADSIICCTSRMIGASSSPPAPAAAARSTGAAAGAATSAPRSEEHTSELQSLTKLVCRLLLGKKKQNTQLLGTTHQ